VEFKADKLKILMATAMVFGAGSVNSQAQNPSGKELDLESLQLLQENGISFEEFDHAMVGPQASSGNYSAHGISSGNYSAHGISSGNYAAHGISSGNYSAHGLSSGNYSAHGVSSGSMLHVNREAKNIPSPEVRIVTDSK